MFFRLRRIKALSRLLGSRHLCVWLVQPQSSQVRKFRFSLSQVFVSLVSTALVALLVLALTGDYARVQVLRLRHYVSYLQVKSERDTLLTRSEQLASELQHLQHAAGERSSAHEQLLGRVEELRALVSTAQDIGAIPPEFGFSKQNPVEKDEVRASLSAEHQQDDELEGVGGAEFPCSSINCLLEHENTRDADIAREIEETQNLVQQLDQLSTIISVLPMGSPIIGHVSSPFGTRRSPFTGRISMHAGVDFSAAHGAAVKTTADGVVKKVGRTSTYGIYVDVRHSADVVTRYAHLSSSLVREGEKVCRGDMLGLVGSTGRSTGPHLHYEIRVRGKTVNPTFFLSLPAQMASLIDPDLIL